MDARTFLGLMPRGADRLQWRLEVTPGISAGGRFLFGGCGLGAGIEAMEQATGRPCVWATAQYLSFAPVGSVLDLEVTLAVTGHQMSQARCVGRVDDQEIFTVNAALGERQFDHRGVWAEAPEVPPPSACPLREHPRELTESIMGRVEARVAQGRQFDELDGTPGAGRSALWCRMPEVLEPSAAALAVLGDFVPGGLGQALGLPAGGNSLDNTLRVVRVVPTDWVLVDLRIQAVDRGFGHGLAHLWAEDGSLLATASQSVIVRFWEGRLPGRFRTAQA
ncbi:MAG TPA: acyl-CoA thioesterase [Acidimicrobiales bacterium]